MVSWLRSLLLGWLISLMFVWGMPASAEPGLETAQSARDFLRLGAAAMQAGELGTAIVNFSQAIELEPQLAAAYGNRCLAQLLLSNNAEAAADCSQAIQLNPSEPETWLNRGLSHYRLGEYEAAVSDYGQLLQLRSADYRAYYNRGLAQIELAAYREAIVDFGTALRQATPMDRVTIAKIHLDRGLAQLMQDNLPSAIGDFTESIRLNASARAFFNRGCAYHRQDNLAAAVADFTEAIALDPAQPDAYLSRGLLRHQLGEMAGAIGDLQQAAHSFAEQGMATAYQQMLDLIEQLQVTEVAIG